MRSVEQLAVASAAKGGGSSSDRGFLSSLCRSERSWGPSNLSQWSRGGEVSFLGVKLSGSKDGHSSTEIKTTWIYTYVFGCSVKHADNLTFAFTFSIFM
jgi:hypothetical protein